MSKRGSLEFVSDILEAISRIEIYIKSLSYDEFIVDIKTQDSVIRNLEIVGEAAGKITNDFKKKCQGIPWKELAGVRDRLIHHYFGINLDIVWTIITVELKEVAKEIKKILNK